MRKLKSKILSAGLASLMLLSSVACNNSGNKDQGNVKQNTDTNSQVKLVYYLWGGEGVANKDILKEINTKLKKDLNTELEIRYIDWGDVATKYPLLFMAGEKFDLTHASPNAAVSYFTLVAEGALADITDHLNVVPKLKNEIPENVWNSAKYKDRIYGVPTLYSEFTPTGFVYRKDKQEEYGVGEVKDIKSMEAYMTAAVENGDLPIKGTSVDAGDLYKLLVDTTDQWIMAPGIPADSLFLVGESIDNFKNIIHPAFTDEFLEHAKLMKKWNDLGFWPKDILSAQIGDKDNFNNGQSVAYLTHMADWTGSYGALQKNLPGVEADFWTFALNNNKILNKAGVENTTAINAKSENIDRSLQVIEKFMTDQSYYNLIQYGIEGRQYEIVDGKIQNPEGFDAEVDGGGFSAWALRNDKFNIPYVTEDPRRYELIDEWKKIAHQNPYSGFSFDDTAVSNELSNIQNVNSTLGIQLMFGKADGDVEAAVENYREQLKAAGIERLIEELKTQLNDFTPNGK